MAGEYLPPVVTRLTGDISDLMAKIATVKAAMKGLNGDGKIKIDTSAASAAVQTLTKNINITKEVTVTYKKAVQDTGAAAAAAATGFRIFGTGIRLTGTALHWITAGTFEFLAVFIPAMVALGTGFLVAMQGAYNTVLHFKALYGATEATAQAFHQTVGTVLGLKPALQAAQDAANPGVYELLGSVVNMAQHSFMNFAGAGLQVVHALDEFAARVNVDLMSGTGSQLHDLLSSMVTDLAGLGAIVANVLHTLLNLAAAMPGLVTFLLAAAVGISHLLVWLTSLNPVLITIAMGLEEFWRWGGLVATVMGLLTRAIIALPTAAFALFVNAVGSAGRIMAAGFDALTMLVGGIGAAAQGIGRFIPVVGRFGEAVSGFGVGIAQMAMDMRLMQGLGAGLGIFITLAVLLGHVKDQAEQVAANVTKAVQSAQGLQVFVQAGIALDKLNMAMIQASTQLHQFSPAVQTAGTDLAAFQTKGVDPLLQGISHGIGLVGSFGRALASWGKTQIGGGILVSIGNFFAKFGGATQAASDLQVLNTAEAQILTQTAIVGRNMLFLGSTFHTTAIGANYLAQAAGVNLSVPLTKGSEAAKIAVQQIDNLKRGMGAMSAPMGVVGNDMTALGIQSQLTASKVGQLNSAWDAWISSITSTAGDMSQVQTTLIGMDHAALQTSAGITGNLGNITRAAKGTAYTLKGFGQAAMQSWQQFSQAINTGNTALDQLRIGMAEGVVSGAQFTSTVKGLVGEMLPFTQGNRTAVKMLSNLAHEAAGPTTSSLRTLANWAGITGKAARDQFVKGMLAATNSMGDMSKVAGNLSSVLNGQLDAALAAAIVKFSGVNSAIQKYVQDVSNSHTPQSVLQGDLSNLAGKLANENRIMGVVSKGWNTATGQANNLAGAARGAAAGIDLIHSKTVTITANFVQTGNWAAANPFQPGGSFSPGRHASGTSNAPRGWSWVGEQGPELMYLRGGEQIKSHPQSVAMANAASGGSSEVVERQPIIVTLDGQVLYKAVETRVYQRNMQNGVRNPRGGAQGRFGVR